MIDIKPFSYTNESTPEGYYCTKCGVTNCKLWREYNTCWNIQTFFCMNCALKDQFQWLEGCGYVQSDGLSYQKYCGMNSMIGNLPPCIPCEDGETAWGTFSTPQEGWKWWKALPLYDISANEVY